MLDQKIKIYVLENQKSKGQNQIFRNENFTKMAKSFRICKGLHSYNHIVHKNSRKISVFREFLKFFILAFLVCQRALSTYVDSQKITDIVVFSVFSFIDVLRLANTLKNALQ